MSGLLDQMDLPEVMALSVRMELEELVGVELEELGVGVVQGELFG